MHLCSRFVITATCQNQRDALQTCPPYSSRCIFQGLFKNTFFRFGDTCTMPPKNTFLPTTRILSQSGLVGVWVVTWCLRTYFGLDIYGKCLHKRTNQQSNNYVHRGVTSNTTYLEEFATCSLTKRIAVAADENEIMRFVRSLSKTN